MTTIERAGSSPVSGIRLSGWARLWIVIAALFWLGRALVIGTSVNNPCESIMGVTTRGAASGPDSRPVVVSTRYERVCAELWRRGAIDDPAQLWRHRLKIWAVFGGIAAAVWIVAMVAKSVAMWVWRGFR